MVSTRTFLFASILYFAFAIVIAAEPVKTIDDTTTQDSRALELANKLARYRQLFDIGSDDMCAEATRCRGRWHVPYMHFFREGFIEYTSTRQWRFYPKNMAQSFALAEEIGELGRYNRDIGEIIKSRTFSKFGGQTISALIDRNGLVRCVKILPNKS